MSRPARSEQRPQPILIDGQQGRPALQKCVDDLARDPRAFRKRRDEGQYADRAKRKLLPVWGLDPVFDAIGSDGDEE